MGILWSSILSSRRITLTSSYQIHIKFHATSLKSDCTLSYKLLHNSSTSIECRLQPLSIVRPLLCTWQRIFQHAGDTQESGYGYQSGLIPIRKLHYGHTCISQPTARWLARKGRKMALSLSAKIARKPELSTGRIIHSMHTNWHNAKQKRCCLLKHKFENWRDRGRH